MSNRKDRNELDAMLTVLAVVLAIFLLGKLTVEGLVKLVLHLSK